MFDLFASLFDQNDAPAEGLSGPLALGALLVEAAHRDGSYDDVERQTILAILKRERSTTDIDAEALLREAEAEQRKAIDLFRFTHAIKESTPFEDRVGVIEDLWEVILSDGSRHNAEDGMVRSVCGLLGVPDRESGLARARVQKRLG